MPIVKKSFNQFMNETLSTKFAETLNNKNSIQSEIALSDETPSESDIINKINTTSEELEGYAIIKSILREDINPDDINYKDTETYFGILYQNNTRKWICRLYLGTKKSIVFPTVDKGQERIYIDSLNDLYQYEDKFKNIVQKFI